MEASNRVFYPHQTIPSKKAALHLLGFPFTHSCWAQLHLGFISTDLYTVIFCSFQLHITPGLGHNATHTVSPSRVHVHCLSHVSGTHRSPGLYNFPFTAHDGPPSNEDAKKNSRVITFSIFQKSWRSLFLR